MFDQLTASGVEVPAFTSTTPAVVPEENTLPAGQQAVVPEENTLPAGQQGDIVVTLSVHAFLTDDGSKGYGGMSVYINGKFVTTACFAVPGTGLAGVFANACTKAVSTVDHVAVAAAGGVPQLLILQSDQLHLLETVFLAPEVENLREVLRDIRHEMAHVSLEANTGSVQLAEYAFEIELEDHLTDPDLPEWVYGYFD